ncbi:MAG: amino acid ABC transporter substrate-binding protein [Firmicutes bacterium]|nr:amino acid ABC transporter substrate-binding protein [Bacillota bacterium]
MNFKKRNLFLKIICLFSAFTVLVSLTGCENQKKIIYIAIAGSRDDFTKSYDEGIKMAYEDVCRQYKDSNFEIIGEFYDDKGNYELSDRIMSRISKNEEVTAILASSEPDICENQIYQSDRSDKILVCPFGTYDRSINTAAYDKVFLTSFSNKEIGGVMVKIAGYKPDVKNWVICCGNSISCKEEIEYIKNNSNLNVVDIVEIDDVSYNLDTVVHNWQMLNVDGAFIIPDGNNNFEFLYNLKRKMPDLCVIADSKLDNDSELGKNGKYFDNFSIVASFYTDLDEMTPNDWKRWNDSWSIHGYNSFRMIVDTAVEIDSNDPEKIAEHLHKNGYFGKFESYSFNNNGSLVSKEFPYADFFYDAAENDVKVHLKAIEGKSIPKR